MRKQEGERSRPAGHRAEDLLATAQAVGLLATLQIELTCDAAAAVGTAGRAVPDTEPLLVIQEAHSRPLPDGRDLAVAWRFRLGPWLGACGHGREPAALFPRSTLKYDPYRRRLAQRLARYLTFHFRMNSSRHGPLTRSIGPLLHKCAVEPDGRNPERTRQALERALDLLQADGLLANWCYEEAVALPARGWLPEWLGGRLSIAPPPLVKDRYMQLPARTPATRDI